MLALRCDIGVFSFNQNKQISTGEGGMLITNSPQKARIAQAVRNHGEVADPELGLVGYNYRLCEIESCLALEQFKRIDEKIAFLRDKAWELDRYFRSIGIDPPIVKEGCSHSYYRYAVRTHREVNGGKKGYVEPLYKLPIYQRLGYKDGLCPVTEKVNREIQLINLNE